ncbi:hypothetical protein V8G54_003877, partial [Vigna mungo]
CLSIFEEIKKLKRGSVKRIDAYLVLLSVFVIICTFFAPKLCISLPYFYPSFAIQLRNLSPLSFTTCSKSLTHCFILATLSVFCHLSKKISTMFGSMIQTRF